MIQGFNKRLSLYQAVQRCLFSSVAPFQLTLVNLKSKMKLVGMLKLIITRVNLQRGDSYSTELAITSISESCNAINAINRQCIRRLHARVVDQPRGTTQVRDAALSGGAGPTSGTISAASTSRASRAGRGGDRVQPAPTTPNTDNSVVVVHLAEPPAEEKLVHVFHQHRNGAVAAPEEEGHLQAVQPPADVGDPHVGRGGPVGRAGDPRSERVPGCAHALGLHSHFIASAAATAAAASSSSASNGDRPAAADTVAAGAERAAYPCLGVGTGT